MKSPKDPRLSDGWRWQLARAPPPESRSEHSVVVRRRPHDDNLAGLSEVKGLE